MRRDLKSASAKYGAGVQTTPQQLPVIIVVDRTSKSYMACGVKISKYSEPRQWTMLSGTAHAVLDSLALCWLHRCVKLNNVLYQPYIRCFHPAPLFTVCTLEY